jgi:PAS domain S-box-containing protein
MIREIGPSSLQCLDLLTTPVWVWDFDKSGLWWGNQAAVQFWGAKDLSGLTGNAPPLTDSALANLSACRRYLQNATPFDGLWPIRTDGGQEENVPCRFSPVRIDGKRVGMLTQVLADPPAAEPAPVAGATTAYAPGKIIAQVGQFMRLLEAQIGVLELISNGASVETCLDSIVDAAERLLDPARASILLVQPFRNALQHVAGANLPKSFVDAVNGSPIGPKSATFGAAAFRRARVVSTDVASDPVWHDLRELALAHDLRACWAQPIVNDKGEVLGTLVVYYAEAKAPTAQDCWVVEALAGLARFAIENERQRADLSSANERFSSLATTVPGVVYQRIIYPDGQIRYTFINDAVKDLFGVSPEEVLTDPKALFDCFDPQYRSTFQQRLASASHELKLWDVEATIIARDGRRKFTHAIARPTPQPDGSVVWDGIILDATRIKEAEIAAQAAEARSREAITESIPQGLILYDDRDAFVICNSAFLNLYPFLADVAVSGATYASIVRAKVEHEVAGVPDVADPAPMVETRVAERLERHQQGNFVEERRLADGRWILINEHRTENGSTVILYTDVSELKEREAALQRSNRELQDFASVASHDLQEPLRKIEAFGDRLRDKCSAQLSDDGKVYLERMQHAAARMRQLINDLLTYSRVTTKAQPFVRVDLNNVFDEVLIDLQIAIENSGAEVTRGDLPTLDADALQMRILLQNLLSNALKFRRMETPLKITVTAEAHPAASPKNPLGVRLGEVCELAIADNGIGFDMKYADRIFGIFQRLHGRNEYEGTGVGLATVRKIVERHSGRIRPDSAPGVGTTFFVALPAKQSVK